MTPVTNKKNGAVVDLTNEVAKKLMDNPTISKRFFFGEPDKKAKAVGVTEPKK